MKNSTILTVIGAKCPNSLLAPVADIARAKNLHLAYLAVGAVPQFPNYGVGMLPYGAPVVPDTWQEEVHQVGADLKTKVDEIEDFLSKEDLSGDVQSACAEPTGLTDLVARRAKLCDVALVSNGLRDDPDTFRNVLNGLLFGSSAPVVLNDLDGSKALDAKNIMIAWNTSLPASRAVKRALPMLKQAEKVTVVVVDPVIREMADGDNPGSDLGKWLSHHGCNVTVEQHPSGGKPISDSLIERAKELGADLIVAGAYGHSKLRETLLGGTTASLVEQRDVAVFLAH